MLIWCWTEIINFLQIILKRQLRGFPRSCLITWFVIRETRRVPLMKQELLIFPEHLHPPPGFNGVRVSRSLVLCVCFVNRCLFFFFWPLCSLSLYWFLLPLWDLQTLLTLRSTWFHPRVLVGFVCYSIFSFMCMFCISLLVLCSFSFGHCVVQSLPVLLFTNSDCPFGIFKLFFHWSWFSYAITFVCMSDSRQWRFVCEYFSVELLNAIYNNSVVSRVSTHNH